MNQEYQQTVADRQEWELWQVYNSAREHGYPHSFDEFCVDWDCMIDVAKTTDRSYHGPEKTV